MIVPVFTRLDTMATADAFGRIEENASRSAVTKLSGWDEIAVL